MTGDLVTLTIDMRDGGPCPFKPDDFLRTRTKKGARFYLVAGVRPVQRKKPGLCPRVKVSAYPATEEQWMMRDASQGSFHFHFYTPPAGTHRNRPIT